MSPLLILIASLIGSPHCAGMCGGFVAVASHTNRPMMSQSLYHVGRLITYCVLGMGAGWIGGAVDRTALPMGVTHAASAVSGILLIAWGLSMLTGHSMLPRFTFAAKQILRFRAFLNRSTRAEYLLPLTLGISSTLLPCGWLYSYVAVAAGTGSPSFGVLVMLIFWLGTLPLLVTVGSLAKYISSPLKRFLPVATAILIVAAGFFSLFGHLGFVGLSLSSHEHCGHGPPEHAN